MVDWSAADRDRCPHDPQHVQWVTADVKPIFVCKMATTHIQNAILSLESGRDTDIPPERRDWWIEQLATELHNRMERRRA